MARLIVRIEKDGSVKIMVKEAPGKACVETSKQLEKKLGEVVNKQYTMEYYQTLPNSHSLTSNQE